MKRSVSLCGFLPNAVVDGASFVWSQWWRQKLPVVIFLVLCLNLALAPAVYAATGGTIARWSAYAIGLLGLVTFGLCIYLFVVVFQPERF